VDPISLIVIALAAYGIMQRVPGLVGEVAQSLAAAGRGEESQTVKDRRKRLVEAGIDPATGGPARQFLANWWRDFWLDMDRRRQQAGPLPGAGTAGAWRREAWQRLGERVNRWRRTSDDNPATPNAPEADGGPDPTDPPADPRPQPQPPQPGGPDPTAPLFPPPPTAPHHPPPYVPPDQRTPPDSGDPSGHPEPIRVASTIGEPATSPVATATGVLEGGPMSGALTTAGGGTVAVAVTGVVSGAAEARAISIELDRATQSYLADLRRIRGRIHNVGDQAITIVQFDARSTVVGAIAEAAASAAAAEAFARGVQNEVDPVLHNVAREFDRRNS
jgi:hypothetical protein